MIPRKLLGLTLMTGLLFCLLAVPATLARPITSYVNEPALGQDDAEQVTVSPRTFPPGIPPLIPSNPMVEPRSNTPTTVATSTVFLPLVMATGGPVFWLSSVRKLTPCENEGRHHIFTRVVNAQGVGISGIPLKICWGPGTNDCAHLTTGGSGWAEFAMFKGVYSVQVAIKTSQVASGLTGDYAMDEPCEETGNPVANSRFHVSFEVIFHTAR